MKIIVLGLVMFGSLALAVVSIANAAPPPECGKSYAMLITGALPSSDQATGGSGHPGALTPAIGVGVISFGPAGSAINCSSVSGELIFNAGDVQTSPAGEFFGPTSCYDGMSAMGTGVPCFDGNNHLTGTIQSAAFGAEGQQTMQFTASYGWLNGAKTSGTFGGLEFTLRSATGAETVVGSTLGGGILPRPALTITLQKIGLTPVGTAYGSAPYLGESQMSCNSYKANQTDFVAAGEAPPAIAGSFGSIVGALQIFATGQGGGIFGLDSNDMLGNQICAFSNSPGTAFGSGASQFADGTSNAVDSFTGAGPPCVGEFSPGAGYATSSVVWGSTDKNAYSTITGLLGTGSGISPQTVFTPPGGMATCTGLAIAPAGNLTAKIVPVTLTVTTGTNAVPAVKAVLAEVTNTSPAGCHVSASILPVAAPGIQCNAAFFGDTSTLVNGEMLGGFQLNCTCGAKTPAETDTYNVSFTSSDCPIVSGAGPTLFTCKN